MFKKNTNGLGPRESFGFLSPKVVDGNKWEALFVFNAIQCVIYLYSYGRFPGGYAHIIYFKRIFHYKLSSYWGSPMTGNPHISVITIWYRSNAELQTKAHAAKRRPGVGVGPRAQMDVATPAWKSMVSWVCDEHLLQEDYELLGIIIPGFCFGQA